MFSFTRNNSSMTKEASAAVAVDTKSPNDSSNSDNDGDIVAQDDSGDLKPKGLSVTQQQSVINNNNNMPISADPSSLGRVEGLRTDKPTFKIPFPHLNKYLVFEGKKVPTASKYLALSCSGKKNGKVHCKVRNAIAFAMIFY